MGYANASLYDDIDALAVELQALSKARTKTEAVRSALRHEIDRMRQAVPLHDRIAKIQAEAAKLGLPNSDFDFKAFTDEMWDDT
ncbi:type II toxin-antitoxin system VapB family antitoxin [Rhizobium sp. CB3090]|uniref:type II toxin-antitoxin system VapB family antitoxin n=1 Tax=Rhizobium sp. CB3090 TaxID=3039156 RepID=UPI0024B1125C|nr:type II toxin-antitoxin system VapB family antitoxin [Rhizobium sp. CB3090]WFU10108.1 type II toxin-antitoxin system VapB family antitoxin [Rhizobium sp. CB3090]